MLLFGHPYIDSPKFYRVSSIEDISQTPPNSIIYFENFESSIEIIKFAISNGVDIGVKVTTIKEAILCENLRVKYSISKPEVASKIQRVVDNYLFDLKNLAFIESEDEIEGLANNKIDGAIFLSSSIVN